MRSRRKWWREKVYVYLRRPYRKPTQVDEEMISQVLFLQSLMAIPVEVLLFLYVTLQESLLNLLEQAKSLILSNLSTLTEWLHVS